MRGGEGEGEGEGEGGILPFKSAACSGMNFSESYVRASTRLWYRVDLNYDDIPNGNFHAQLSFVNSQHLPT